jgi:hypothetical protein
MGPHPVVNMATKLPGREDWPIHVYFRVGVLGDRLYVTWLAAQCVHLELEERPGDLSLVYPFHEYVEAKKIAGEVDSVGWAENYCATEAATKELRAFVHRSFQTRKGRLWAPSKYFVSDRRIEISEHGLASRKVRTVSYWWMLREYSPFRLMNDAGDNVSQDPEAWEAVAARMDDLPTVGVDPEAVACCRGMAKVCREVGGVFRQTSFRAWTSEAIARSLQGDAVGAIGSRIGAVGQREQEIAERVRGLREQFQDTRVRLTEKYECEFP